MFDRERERLSDIFFFVRFVSSLFLGSANIFVTQFSDFFLLSLSPARLCAVLLSAGNTKLVDRRENYPIYSIIYMHTFICVKHRQKFATSVTGERLQQPLKVREEARKSAQVKGSDYEIPDGMHASKTSISSIIKLLPNTSSLYSS